MDRIKKIKVKKADGTMTDYIPIGADARNIDLENGSNVEEVLSKKPYVYESVAAMKADSKLKAGDVCETLGYYSANDGGQGLYLIKNGSYTDDGGSYHKIKDGIFAELIINENTINVKQFGAYGNKTNDDTIFIKNAIKYIKDRYEEETSDLNILCFPKGSYRTTSTLTIGNYITLKAIGNVVIFSDHDDIAILLETVSNISVPNNYYYTGEKIEGNFNLIHIGTQRGNSIGLQLQTNNSQSGMGNFSS